MGSMIRFDKVSFAYKDQDKLIPAIHNLSLEISPGTHLAIIGHNGSGKSTLGRLCNSLEIPDQGRVEVAGLSADSMESVYEIRRICGMVFQNPDDQIVGNTCEEDVAFGPCNLGLPSEEIQQRVTQALQRVGLDQLALKAPHHLSGGQKQKLSIAGVLAMQPSCIILDEASAMLDPASSKELMTFIRNLCQEEGLTLINITHDMNEAIYADQVLVLRDGERLAMDTPRKIFASADFLREQHLALPMHLAVVDAFSDHFTSEEKAQALYLPESATLFANKLNALRQAEPGVVEERLVRWQRRQSPVRMPSDTVLAIRDLSFRYNRKSKESHLALDAVNLDVRRGEIIVICGHTGSGKSTLLHHLNGLNRVQAGDILYRGKSLKEESNIPFVRQDVGLVFQYPEKQLFAETVKEDIAFGPKQVGLNKAEIDQRIEETFELLKLPTNIMDRSPFDLSGGQQRKVAMAGILVMQPNLLLLDEPAAGLDPRATEEMLTLVEDWRRRGKTIVMVTHNMDDAARLADRMVVMAEGKVLMEAPVDQIFHNSDIVKRARLEFPHALDFARALQEQTGLDFAFYRTEEAIACLTTCLGWEEAAHV